MRPASFVSNEPKPKKRRAPWTPNKHGWVIGACGHVTADDLEIVAFGVILTKFPTGTGVYCDQCEDFVPVVKRATLKDTIARIIGVVPLPIPDDQPF